MRKHRLRGKARKRGGVRGEERRVGGKMRGEKMCMMRKN